MYKVIDWLAESFPGIFFCLPALIRSRLVTQRLATWKTGQSARALCRLADARLRELLQAFRETSQLHRQRMQKNKRHKPQRVNCCLKIIDQGFSGTPH